ncbi:hypothetical protein T484DRAFT_2700057 [Baffinella frigidus]|nr:hypothetical protein T484DRAFT_2700057 [Cryptophyta sp. CCMP2293]
MRDGATDWYKQVMRNVATAHPTRGGATTHPTRDGATTHPTRDGATTSSAWRPYLTYVITTCLSQREAGQHTAVPSVNFFRNVCQGQLFPKRLPASTTRNVSNARASQSPMIEQEKVDKHKLTRIS